jgi:preprotein translocase subunit SecA
MPLESNLLTTSLENAQKKVELYNYDLRKNVFQYDEILNIQRKQIFKARKELLCETICQDFFLRYSESFFDETFSIKKKEKLLRSFEKSFDSYSSFFLSLSDTVFSNEIWISNDLRFAHSNFYESNFLKTTRGSLILSILDYYWTEHIERMNYIRETINWRSYGQQNPLTEYNIEAFESFKLMFDQIRSSMIYYFLNHSLLNIK